MCFPDSCRPGEGRDPSSFVATNKRLGPRPSPGRRRSSFRLRDASTASHARARPPDQCSIAKPASSRRRTPPISSCCRSGRTAIAFFALLAIVFVVVPLTVSDYWFTALLIPSLIFSLAAIGLNILTGYAGQLSLGSAAFMAVGAFAAYNFVLRVPGCRRSCRSSRPASARRWSASRSGCRRSRIRGFYLAVATLAAQFFVVWALQKFSWFTNDSASGVISAQPVTFFGLAIDSPVAQLPVRARHRRRARARGEEHGALEHRAPLDGGARHGRRGRGDRHPADAHEAARVRDQLVLLRRRRRAVRVLLHRHGRARGVQPRDVVPHPVHDHRRRHGHDHGRVHRLARSSRCCRSCCRSSCRASRRCCTSTSTRRR